MRMRLEGQTALITGAGSGIGRATALGFAAEGARVAVTDLHSEAAEEVAAAVRAQGGEAYSCELDVRLEEAWAGAVSELVERWGRLDILVANAGVSLGKGVGEMSLEEWRHVHSVNLEGAFLGAKHGVVAMRRGGGGGNVVFVSSASGVRAAPGASAYSSSKAGLRWFAKSLVRECAPDGIRVNTVIPGGVMTPLWETMPFFRELEREHGGRAGAWKALAGETPLGRFAEPEEIAAGIVYLASPEASYVTGAELVIDGGYTA